jgi:hypothetical protein
MRQHHNLCKTENNLFFQFLNLNCYKNILAKIVFCGEKDELEGESDESLAGVEF